MNDWQPKPFIVWFALNGQPNPCPHSDFFPWPDISIDLNYTARLRYMCLLERK